MKEDKKNTKKGSKKQEENLRYLPPIISLFAGLVISVVSLVRKTSSLTSLILVFSFLFGFYIIGLIFRAILLAFATKEPENEEKTEESLENVDTEENTEKDEK